MEGDRDQNTQVEGVESGLEAHKLDAPKRTGIAYYFNFFGILFYFVLFLIYLQSRTVFLTSKLLRHCQNVSSNFLF